MPEPTIAELEMMAKTFKEMYDQWEEKKAEERANRVPLEALSFTELRDRSFAFKYSKVNITPYDESEINSEFIKRIQEKIDRLVAENARCDKEMKDPNPLLTNAEYNEMKRHNQMQIDNMTEHIVELKETL